MSEGHVLTGYYDTEDLKVGVMLGVWKPLNPTGKIYFLDSICTLNSLLKIKVCDKPLAVMDARTFNKENEVPQKLHINFIAMMFHNLGSNIIFDTMQKWYYYSMQTTKEVLVFHQYTKVGKYTNSVRKFNKQKSYFQDKFLANPHTAFENRNCPKDTESRISIESRVALFF